MTIGSRPARPSRGSTTRPRRCAPHWRRMRGASRPERPSHDRPTRCRRRDRGWLSDEAPDAAPQRLVAASLRLVSDRHASAVPGRSVQSTRPMSAEPHSPRWRSLRWRTRWKSRLRRSGSPSPTPSADPSPSLPAVVAPSSTPSTTAPTASALPEFDRRLDRHRLDGHAPRWPRRRAAPRRPGVGRGWRERRGERHLRGVVRPEQRDLVRHREHAEAPRWLPGHDAARRQGARRRVDDPDAETRSRARRSTTRKSGTWSATGTMVSGGARHGHIAARRQRAREGKRRLRAVRSGQRDLDRHSVEAGAAPQPRGHPAARWQGARGGRPRRRRHRDRLGRAVRPGHGILDRDRQHAHPARRDRGRAASRWQRPRGGPSAAPASAEVYDPATATWTATGDLARPGAATNRSRRWRTARCL